MSITVNKTQAVISGAQQDQRGKTLCSLIAIEDETGVRNG
jgi:hypothetical protein